MHEDVSTGKSPGLCPELGVEGEGMLLISRLQGYQLLATKWARPQPLAYEKAESPPPDDSRHSRCKDCFGGRGESVISHSRAESQPQLHF